MHPPPPPKYSVTVWHPDGTHNQCVLATKLITVLPSGILRIGETRRTRFQQTGCLQIKPTNGAAIDLWNDFDSAAEFHRDITLPYVTNVGDFWIDIHPQCELHELDVAQLNRPRRIGRRGNDQGAQGRPPSRKTVKLWLEALGAVQHHPANSTELFKAVARATVNPGGLDAALIIAHDDEDAWRIVSSEIDSPPFGAAFQFSIAERVAHTGKAVIVDGFAGAPHRSVLAVPYFNEQNTVAGMIYGQRDRTKKNARQKIRQEEVQYAQTLAETLTSGFRRLAMEDERNRIRYTYARCFSPPVLRAIESDPQLLDARETTASIMLADLRNFTHLAQHLESKRSFDLLTEAMNCLTECIMETEGIVIDYFGDGLAAMWNAPQKQAAFAAAAVTTGDLMQRRIRKLSERWEAVVGEPLTLVTAIATGSVIVGNSGSDFRIKYGPRGTTVRLASRLESAAKKLNAEVLVCGKTFELLDDSFHCQRLGSARVRGIDESYDIYQVLSPSDESTPDVFEAYEDALRDFDNENYEAAIATLEKLNLSGSHFGATETLREQAEFLNENGHRFELAPIQFIPKCRTGSSNTSTANAASTQPE